MFINGGRSFPYITQSYRVRYRPRLTIYQALLETGVVRFSPSGRIVSVSGVFVGPNVNSVIRLNGRVVPSTALYYPIQRGDWIEVGLSYGLLREEENSTSETAETIQD
ncbi:hypothetical protein AB6A23_02565 [Paenibacillus tarimensis]